MFGFLYFCDVNSHCSHLVLFSVIACLSDGDVYVCVCTHTHAVFAGCVILDWRFLSLFLAFLVWLLSAIGLTVSLQKVICRTVSPTPLPTGF